MISSFEKDILVAMSLVLPKGEFQLGQLHSFDVNNFLRRLKYRLDAAEIAAAIGGIDFSFNENVHGIHPGLWCPHAYVITAADNEDRLRRTLRGFKATDAIPRPRKVVSFENNAYRRSYAMKMLFERRIGYDDQCVAKNGKIRHFRQTRRGKLRAAERLELFLFLDHIGYAGRSIFRFIKPAIRNRKRGKRAYFGRITPSQRNGES